MSKTLTGCIALVIALLATCVSSTQASDSDVDVDNGTLFIETDESHDLIFVQIIDDEVVMHILQYDPDEFDEVPNLFAFTEEELIDMADDYRYEDRDLDDISMIVLETFGGNDVVFFHENVYLATVAYLGDGDDHMETGGGYNYVYAEQGNDWIEGRNASYNFMDGGAGDDTLKGCDYIDYMRGRDGNDKLYGRGGKDYLYGYAGNDLLDGSYDGEVDYMNGGDGADTFRSRYYELVPVTIYVPYYTMEYQTIGRIQIPVWVLRYRVITYWVQQDLENENVADFDANEGDILDARRIY